MTRLIAHRGGAGLRIENTLAAFEHAIELGASGAELDVHLTRDGQVVVHHNALLNPGYCRRVEDDWIAKDQRPAIAELTWAELQGYEIGVPRPGSAYAKRFDSVQPMPGQRIPLLRDVIRLVRTRSPQFRLVIEIKAYWLDAGKRLWQSLVDATLGIVEEESFFDRSVLCSFDWGALLYARQRKPDLVTWFTSAPLSWLSEDQPPVTDLPPETSHLEAVRSVHGKGDAPWFAGFDPRRFAGGYPEAIAAAGGAAWLLYYRDATPQQLQPLAAYGLEGIAWTVNLRDKAALRHLLRSGVQQVMLDYPDMDLKALAADP